MEEKEPVQEMSEIWETLSEEGRKKLLDLARALRERDGPEREETSLF